MCKELKLKHITKSNIIGKSRLLVDMRASMQDCLFECLHYIDNPTEPKGLNYNCC